MTIKISSLPGDMSLYYTILIWSLMLIWMDSPSTQRLDDVVRFVVFKARMPCPYKKIWRLVFTGIVKFNRNNAKGQVFTAYISVNALVTQESVLKPRQQVGSHQSNNRLTIQVALGKEKFISTCQLKGYLNLSNGLLSSSVIFRMWPSEVLAVLVSR